jgi:hypothetical protein
MRCDGFGRADYSMSATHAPSIASGSYHFEAHYPDTTTVFCFDISG